MLNKIMAVPGGFVCSVASDGLPKIFRIWPKAEVKQDEVYVDEQLTGTDASAALADQGKGEWARITSVPSHYIASWAYIELIVSDRVER